MKLKQWQNIYHEILNAHLIVPHVIQNKNGIIKHANVNVKFIISWKNSIV